MIVVFSLGPGPCSGCRTSHGDRDPAVPVTIVFGQMTREAQLAIGSSRTRPLAAGSRTRALAALTAMTPVSPLYSESEPIREQIETMLEETVAVMLSFTGRRLPQAPAVPRPGLTKGRRPGPNLPLRMQGHPGS